MNAAPVVYEFCEFRLDLRRRALFRCGEQQKLTSKQIQLLELFVSRAGTVISKSEIMAAMWPDISVGEENIYVHVSNLRKIIGPLIQPAHGGYIFDAPVTAIAGAAPPDAFIAVDVKRPEDLRRTLGFHAFTLNIFCAEDLPTVRQLVPKIFDDLPLVEVGDQRQVRLYLQGVEEPLDGLRSQGISILALRSCDDPDRVRMSWPVTHYFVVLKNLEFFRYEGGSGLLHRHNVACLAAMDDLWSYVSCSGAIETCFGIGFMAAEKRPSCNRCFGG